MERVAVLTELDRRMLEAFSRRFHSDIAILDHIDPADSILTSEFIQSG